MTNRMSTTKSRTAAAAYARSSIAGLPLEMEA